MTATPQSPRGAQSAKSARTVAAATKRTASTGAAATKRTATPAKKAAGSTRRRPAAPGVIPDDPTMATFAAAGAVPARARVLAVPVFTDLSSPDGAFPDGAFPDRAFPDGGADRAAAYLRQRRFEGRPGQALALPSGNGTTLIALGVGERGAVTADDLRRAAAALARQAGDADHVATTLLAALSQPARTTKAAQRAAAGTGAAPLTADRAAAAIVEGFALGAYRYAGSARGTAGTRVERVTVVGASRDAVRRGQVVAEAACRARDWVNRPPRNLTPRELARLAVREAGRVGLRAQVWDEKRIAAANLGGLLGVAAGAAEPPRLIRLEHRARRAAATVHLVGKGITFDSGGLSLKPPASMMTMKDDMGGAAAVICATVALAQLDVPVNVVCWVAATENMPSGTAIHPGDVLTARNGKTIEVLNTDAEGRLVLADALSLAVEEKPDAIIDVATLTGGQRVALGDKVAAVMGTDADLIRRVIDAGTAAGEPYWELPLYAPYRKQLDSEVADLKNVAGGPAASSIMAGLFLQEFAGEGAWAHLDIAAPAWSESEDGWIAKGGTGWGVRSLVELVANW